MGEDLADMILTDPPYNVAVEGRTDDKLTIINDNFKDSESFYNFLAEAFKNMYDVTRPGGSIYVCHADSQGMNFRRAYVDAGFLLKQCIIWVKNSLVFRKTGLSVET